MRAAMAGVYSAVHVSTGGVTMAIRVTRGGLAAAAVACLFACSKKGDEQKQSANEPAAAAKRRESAAQLAAPVGLFGHIPADTPYVFASFEPIPSSYWQKLAPFVKGALDSVPAADPSASPSERFALAFMRDLKANLDKGGLPGTLGIGAAS